MSLVRQGVGGVQEALQRAYDRMHQRRKLAYQAALQSDIDYAYSQDRQCSLEQMVLAYSPRFTDMVTSSGGTIVTHEGRQYVSTQTLLDATPENVDTVQVTFGLRGQVPRLPK